VFPRIFFLGDNLGDKIVDTEMPLLCNKQNTGWGKCQVGSSP